MGIENGDEARMNCAEEWPLSGTRKGRDLVMAMCGQYEEYGQVGHAEDADR